MYYVYLKDKRVWNLSFKKINCSKTVTYILLESRVKDNFVELNVKYSCEKKICEKYALNAY